jgi:hypothetical protein
MLERLRKLFGGGGEVLGGGDSDDTKFAGAASLGGVGAVSDRHRQKTDEDTADAAHGDDALEPRVPPDPPA